MLIIGRWDESSPVDAILVPAGDTVFAVSRSIQVPLELDGESTLLYMDSGDAVVKETSTIEMGIKLNLEANSASTSKAYDTAVVFLTINGSIYSRSVIYARPQPERDSGKYTCSADLMFDVQANDRISLYAYRIVSRGSIRVISAESAVSVRRRRVRDV